MGQNSAIDYKSLEISKATEGQEELTKRLKAKSRESSGGDNLKHRILSLVASQNYEAARESLTAYVDDRSAFPLFQERAQKYVSHAMDLIQAVELKRNFPGVASLTFAKQQEIHEGVLRHFEELKGTLQSIQKSEREHKLQDLRSTTWFLSTLSHSMFLVTTVAFMTALNQGLARSFFMVLDTFSDQVSSWIIRLFGG